MKTGIIGKLRRVVRTLTQRADSSAPTGLILLYHRVTEVGSDPWGVCVTPQHFAEHLEVLQKHCHPMSLIQFCAAHREGNVPERAVVITSDDGYVDNLQTVKPLLEKFDIPATAFLIAPHPDTGREFWWDELEYVLLQTETL